MDALYFEGDVVDVLASEVLEVYPISVDILLKLFQCLPIVIWIFDISIFKFIFGLLICPAIKVLSNPVARNGES